MPGSDFDESESVSVNPEFLEILKTLNPNRERVKKVRNREERERERLFTQIIREIDWALFSNRSLAEESKRS